MGLEDLVILVSEQDRIAMSGTEINDTDNDWAEEVSAYDPSKKTLPAFSSGSSYPYRSNGYD
jgi:hypothetical protein